MSGRASTGGRSVNVLCVCLVLVALSREMQDLHLSVGVVVVGTSHRLMHALGVQPWSIVDGRL